MSRAGASVPGALVVGGDFQGLGVLRSLAMNNVPTFLIDHEFNIARFSRHTDRFRRCPPIDREAEFIGFLETLCEEEGLHGWVVFANNDETARVLAQNRGMLGRYFRLPVPSWEILESVYNKKHTYELASRLGVRVPKTFFPQSEEEAQRLELDFPVIIKPAVRDHFYAQTKTKAIPVTSQSDLLEQYRKVTSIIPPSEVMVQEIIPHSRGNLYSFGTFFKDGAPWAKVVARRVRQHPMDFGHATTYAETTEVPELEEVSTRLLSSIDYYGPAEVEFMKDPRDGQYKLLEINCRLWGWHSLAGAAGVDLPWLLYLDLTGQEPPVHGSFSLGVKWMRPITDIPTAVQEIMKRRLKWREYLRSFRGPREFAPAFSFDDPLPFLMEFLLLPYLWKKRGF